MLKRQALIDARKAAGFTQESLAARLGVDTSTVKRWERGYGPSPEWRPKLAKALGIGRERIVELLRQGTGADLPMAADPQPATPFSTASVRGPLHAARPGSTLGMSDVALIGYPATFASALTARSGRESLEFTEWIESLNSTSSMIEYLAHELGRIAQTYVYAAPIPLFHELNDLRGVVFSRLRGGRHRPCDARDLWLCAGTACLLLAHATDNLGDMAAALAHVRAASACADQAGHDGLRAWTAGTAALIAEWTQQHDQAITMARAAQAYKQSTESRIRLALITARAAARRQNKQLAFEAMAKAQALESSDPVTDEISEFGGLLTFPKEKQQYYMGGALSLVGDPSAAQEHSRAALRTYATGAPERRSYGDEALARVDLAHALIRAGSLSEALNEIRPLLELPAERRIVQIGIGASKIRNVLAQPRCITDPDARDMIHTLDTYQAEALTVG